MIPRAQGVPPLSHSVAALSTYLLPQLLLLLLGFFQLQLQLLNLPDVGGGLARQETR